MAFAVSFTKPVSLFLFLQSKARSFRASFCLNLLDQRPEQCCRALRSAFFARLRTSCLTAPVPPDRPVGERLSGFWGHLALTLVKKVRARPGANTRKTGQSEPRLSLSPGSHQGTPLRLSKLRCVSAPDRVLDHLPRDIATEDCSNIIALHSCTGTSFRWLFGRIPPKYRLDLTAHAGVHFSPPMYRRVSC